MKAIIVFFLSCSVAIGQFLECGATNYGNINGQKEFSVCLDSSEFVANFTCDGETYILLTVNTWPNCTDADSCIFAEEIKYIDLPISKGCYKLVIGGIGSYELSIECNDFPLPIYKNEDESPDSNYQSKDYLNSSIGEYIKCSPNPFNRITTLHIYSNEVENIRVFNILGEEISVGYSLATLNPTIALENLPNGIYFAVVKFKIADWQIVKMILMK